MAKERPFERVEVESFQRTLRIFCVPFIQQLAFWIDPVLEVQL